MECECVCIIFIVKLYNLYSTRKRTHKRIKKTFNKKHTRNRKENKDNILNLLIQSILLQPSLKNTYIKH